MDFCFALIQFGTCEAHWSPELYWKIPLQAANSIRIDKTLFLSSYLPGLGATGPAGNGGLVRCVVVYPRREDGMEPWEETSHDRPLYLSPALRRWLELPHWCHPSVEWEVFPHTSSFPGAQSQSICSHWSWLSSTLLPGDSSFSSTRSPTGGQWATSAVSHSLDATTILNLRSHLL